MIDADQFQIFVSGGAQPSKEKASQPTWQELLQNEHKGWYSGIIYQSENEEDDNDVSLEHMDEEEIRVWGENGLAICVNGPFSVLVKNGQGQTLAINGRGEDIDLTPGVKLRPGIRVRPILLFQNQNDSVELKIVENDKLVQQVKIVNLTAANSL